ncbi:amino acid ABC transporter permease [Nonomuraea typhae]|uniref:amino acid ABC transporter permease n=1 Tax=Nonomuraea typhae TaxID=2603600 RepID=UPI0012FA8DC3|nr:amino acid ABC transporter permease [Nonomuraea typhae]
MDLLVDSFPELLAGLAVTLVLGVISFVLGSVLGGLITLARISGVKVLKAAAAAYVSVFRGTPLLIQIMIIYYGLPQIGLEIPPIPSAIIAFTLFSAAYLSENFRAGVLGVDRGQWEAAASMAMPYGKTLRRIIFPQAIRIATPAVGGRFVALMKDTSLASAVTVVELTRVAEGIGTSTFRYMDALLIVGLLYWLVNTGLQVGQQALERRLGRAYS